MDDDDNIKIKEKHEKKAVKSFFHCINRKIVYCVSLKVKIHCSLFTLVPKYISGSAI